MPLIPQRSVSSAAASGAPDMRIWLRRFAAALKSGHIIVEDRDSSQLTPLIPRKAQLTLLRKMIAMADAGKPIRIIISKARQQGLSTFIQDLYAWLCEHIPGYRALTTAHTAVDTAAIFRKATVCYENLPGHRLANVSGSSIEWPNGSAYMARTAGSKGIGRGDTYQLMHFSELAFCQRVAGMDERAITAAINTVPRQPHTIIVIESTGDGPSGIFYEWCMAGERGDGPFELLFFPWFDDDGYRETPPLDWVVPDDLIDLQREFDLDNAQMYYYSIRRAENKSKSGEVGTGDSWFKREYPSRVGDSFSAATGLVYPNFGSANIRDLGEPRGFGWEIYRGFDWGQTTDPTVCLWIAHDPTRPPGLIVHPSCTNTIREFQSYRLDEKTDYPKDKDNHSCFDGDTEVLVRHRGWCRLRDLVSTTGECWTPIGWKPYWNVHVSGHKSVCELVTYHSGSIIATPDHKFWDGSSFVEFATLQEGQEISTYDTKEHRKSGTSGGQATAVYGENVLSVPERTILLEGRQSSASRCMGSTQRANTGWYVYSPHQRRPDGQQDREPTIDANQQTLESARIEAGGPSMGKEAYGQYTPLGLRVAQIEGRSKEAQRMVKGRLGQNTVPNLHLPAVWEGISKSCHGHAQGKVLPLELQDASPQCPLSRVRCGISRGMCRVPYPIRQTPTREAMRTKVCSEAKASGSTRIASIRPLAGTRPVFDLTVDGAHCFVTRTGIVASNCDALRYVVVTEKLSGLVYVFQEYYKYNSAAIRLDGIAREVHAMTGWYVPHGSEMVIGSATPGPDAYIVKDSVADRSMPMYISMLSTWGIPCRGQRKPIVVVGVRERGEILDGCMLVSVLVGGTTKFYRDRIDVVQTAYERAIAAINCHRPRRLTEEEKVAIEKVESQSRPDSLGKAKDPLLAGLYLGH